jgi:hydroxyacylglutathione hydrolase
MRVEMFKAHDSVLKNQTYLAYFANTGVLIDPVWSAKAYEDFMQQHHIVLVGVLLTHSHPDHTELAAYFAAGYDCPVFMSAVEMEYYGFSCKNLTPVYHLSSIDFGRFKVLPVLTPGHTKGSTCYLVDGNMFTGDTIFMEGVGICSENGGDVDQLFDSVQFIKNHFDELTKCWPGHSYGVEAGKELDYILKHNIYFSLNDRASFRKFASRKERLFSNTFK